MTSFMRRRQRVRSRVVALFVIVITGVLALSATAAGRVVSISAPDVQVVRGVGKRVVTVNFSKRDPVVVTATHNGSANFIVHLVKGSDTDFLINEIGPFAGQALVEEVTPGRYRVVVDADGGWVLKFAQGLVPTKRIPGLLSGQGDRVVAVRATSNLQPVVTASHRGRSNFIVHLVGYGRQYGHQDYVFNEIGNFRGQTLLDDVPAGTYYVAVHASGGTWSLRFTR